MSQSKPCTPKGAWRCPHCKNLCKTLAGINRHLYRKHDGDGFGIYFTAMELRALRERATASPYDCGGNPTKDYPGE